MFNNPIFTGIRKEKVSIFTNHYVKSVRSFLNTIFVQVNEPSKYCDSVITKQM